MSPNSPRRPTVLMPDIDYFNEMTEGDLEISASIVSTAIEEMSELCEKIVAAVSAGDFPSAARALHSLRGSAGTIGINGFSEFLLDMEKACLADKPSSIDNYVEILRSVWTTCQIDMERLRTEIVRMSE